MRRRASVAAAAMLAACSTKPAPPAKSAGPEGPRITQFYASLPQLPRGEKSLLCYGVENAKTVWLEPPRHELSAALSRCVEVEPEQTTTYTLTAEGAGAPATQQVTVTVGAAKAKIVEVQVSSLDIKKGDPVSICYKVSNARTVNIQPPMQPAEKPACGVDRPIRTTTYTVTATGAAGDQDQERVTVKVR